MSSQETNKENIDELEEDYYAVLNLSKEATDKEITQAYHKLGLLYHPDKHKDAENKRNAEILFAKIKKVYDVLSDAHRRAIYDSLGVKGLKNDNWQLITRTKTPQEIREEYERLAKEREEKRLRELTNSHGYFNMGINATSLFDNLTEEIELNDDNNDRDEDNDKNLFDFHITDFALQQGIDVPLSNKDSATVSVSLATQANKLANGSLGGSFRRVVSSNSWIECRASIGTSQAAVLKGFRRFSQKCSGTMAGMFVFKQNTLSPSLVSTINYQLLKNVNGRITYAMGFKSKLVTALQYEKNGYQIEVSVQLSVKNSQLALEVSKALLDKKLVLKTSAKLGSFGYMLDVGVNKKVTEFTNVGASILFGSRIGVFLNLRFDRASQSFIFPIHLSSELVPSAIFYGALAPACVYYVAKKLIIDPYVKEKIEKEIQEKKENLKTELLEKRKQALMAQELMRESYARSLEREATNGLIILKALYGKIEESIEISSEVLLDVSVPLQLLVKDHQLEISASTNKSDLQGFYDPCIGEEKTLLIRYKFNGNSYEARFSENEAVRIPKKNHMRMND